MLRRLLQVLSRPLFGTRVIPAEARVDPAQFSEEEFPVYCTKCEYLLRGLPDGRCPECGEEFERGELLVLEYARWRVPRQQRFNRLFKWVAAIGFLMSFLPLGLHAFFSYYLSGIIADPKKARNTLQPQIDQWWWGVYGLLTLQVLCLGVLGTLGIVVMARYWRRAKLRRRVVAGIVPGEQSLSHP